jgi:nucleoside-diphosphate-sugar epimerase
MKTKSSELGMKIVVIGGSGLIGTKLVSNLRQRGHEVDGIALDGSQCPHGRGTGGSACRRSGRRRCGELAFVRGQGSDGVLRDGRAYPKYLEQLVDDVLSWPHIEPPLPSARPVRIIFPYD